MGVSRISHRGIGMPFKSGEYSGSDIGTFDLTGPGSVSGLSCIVTVYPSWHVEKVSLGNPFLLPDRVACPAMRD